MATYTAKARSNLFRVKDEAAFRAWARVRDIGIWEEQKNGTTYFCIYGDGPNSDGWPTSVYDETNDTTLDVEIESELPAHLQDGSVAVLMTTGSMGYADLYGYAVALNSRGEEAHIDMHEICERAGHLGGEIMPM